MVVVWWINMGARSGFEGVQDGPKGGMTMSKDKKGQAVNVVTTREPVVEVAGVKELSTREGGGKEGKDGKAPLSNDGGCPHCREKGVVSHDSISRTTVDRRAFRTCKVCGGNFWVWK